MRSVLCQSNAQRIYVCVSSNDFTLPCIFYEVFFEFKYWKHLSSEVFFPDDYDQANRLVRRSCETSNVETPNEEASPCRQRNIQQRFLSSDSNATETGKMPVSSMPVLQIFLLGALLTYCEEVVWKKVMIIILKLIAQWQWYKSLFYKNINVLTLFKDDDRYIPIEKKSHEHGTLPEKRPKYQLPKAPECKFTVLLFVNKSQNAFCW